MGENPIIQTAFGPVRGQRKVSCLGDAYFSFQGIPYAKPFRGQLRFRDPVDPEPWTDVFDATKEGSWCPNFDFINPVPAIKGDENGLVLNIYAKSLKADSPLPVLVWIHGGAFVTGSGSTTMYGPDFLLQKDVILVTLNYRLGIFGFMSLKDPKLGIPGNVGLKDQLKALKWVQGNISRFGGNPKNVTLFGESAGGASVGFHLISEASKGLFHRAICMSGTAFKRWVSTDPTEVVHRVVQKMGYKGPKNEAEMLNFLESAQVHDIVVAQGDVLTLEERKSGTFLAFGPVVEPYKSEVLCFVPADPLLLARNAWSNNLDVIVGNCSDEGLLVYGLANEPDLKNFVDFEMIIPPDSAPLGSEERKRRALALKQHYYGKEEPTVENLENYVRFLGHKHFQHGSHRMIRSRLQFGSGQTYAYRLNVELPRYTSIFRACIRVPHDRGVAHAEDLLYLFKFEFTPLPPKESEEFRLIQRFVEYFTEFAQKGRLSGWEPTKNLEKPFFGMDITTSGWKMEYFPENADMKLWDSLYKGSNL